MAFSTKLVGIGIYPEHTWIHDLVSWWPSAELAADPRFREVDVTAGYSDHVAVLSPSEALELHTKYLERAGEYDHKSVAKLEKQLHIESPALCWVVVNVYEWESGM